MNKWTEKSFIKKYLLRSFQAISCLLIILFLFYNLFLHGLSPYESHRDYFHQNQYIDETSCAGVFEVRQEFTSKGNLLTNLTVCLGDVANSELQIQLLDGEKVIYTTIINGGMLKPNTWNTIPVDCSDISRDSKYELRITGNNLSSLRLSPTNGESDIFGTCTLDGQESQGTLVVGIQNTYKYVTLGSALHLAVNIIFVILLALLLCYAVLNIEKMYVAHQNSEKKLGLLYAFYFSVYTVLLFNPLVKIRNEVTEFGRVMGGGINAGVDVSKRTGNFSQWFICFAIAFILFYLLANYLKSKAYSEEGTRAAEFLDHVMVLANVNLALRCISYFYKEGQEVAAFVYSEYMIMLVIFLSLAYIIFKLDTKISADHFLRIIVSGLMISYPIAILLTNEWGSGKVLMAVQVIASLVILFTIVTAKINWSKKLFSSLSSTVVMCLAMIPLCTSIFIEMVAILNQHELFLASLREYYFLSILIGVMITVFAAALVYKKNIQVKSWKSLAYPGIVLGIACLWQQIPVSAIYSADVYESANASILVSDFLNFGHIPLVQHYGGHMMTSVWEGILYGLINNDYSGAIFTPYYGYMAAVLAVLFFYLVKHTWNEDAAIVVALFFPFPFYTMWSYWGLGVLVCLAAMSYVKKNTWPRAVVFWFSVVWCATYRLDVGFAFALAAMVSLLSYIISTKNAKAVKQLAITLLAWSVIGFAAWVLLCLAKQVNPIIRLKEFLDLSLSNQNWAYAGIGDAALIRFSWVYLFVPFAVIVSLIVSLFSKEMKKYLGNPKWVLLLTLGFAFVFNFSRGLVRHSLVEAELYTIMWSSYVFLAFFLVSMKKNAKLFLPVFAAFIVSNTLFLAGGIFTDTSIADGATNRIGKFTDTWNLSRFAQEDVAEGQVAKTYWQEIKEKNEVIERIVWEENLYRKVQNYKIVIDALLDDDETFVDFINKSFMYSAMGRECPVYVSQSPLQLSGEYTQEQFIQQIEGVPIVLMPYDKKNNRESSALDGISNAYRYYKVSEYIYRNYVPLCTFENDYAVWCLPERYEEMSLKVQELATSGFEIKDLLANASNLDLHSVEVVANSDGSVNINSTGVDPMVSELQLLFDSALYIDKVMNITIDYETDVSSEMQLFYTTGEGEGFSGNKVLTVRLSSQGTANFLVPMTEFTRLRLDTPEGSNVKITSLRMGQSFCELANYGYDGPYLSEDGMNYSYLPGIHEYALDRLPLLWGEADEKQSVNNNVIATLEYSEGAYRYNIDASEVGDNGNYLKVSIDFYGHDRSGQFETDDESTSASIKIGRLTDGKFETKYVYHFTINEGQKNYMFRISSDYYWYTDLTDAVILECREQLMNVQMEILEGD